MPKHEPAPITVIRVIKIFRNDLFCVHDLALREREASQFKHRQSSRCAHIARTGVLVGFRLLSRFFFEEPRTKTLLPLSLLDSGPASASTCSLLPASTRGGLLAPFLLRLCDLLTLGGVSEPSPESFSAADPFLWRFSDFDAALTASLPELEFLE
jgi:hypothetical protein